MTSEDIESATFYRPHSEDGEWRMSYGTLAEIRKVMDLVVLRGKTSESWSVVPVALDREFGDGAFEDSSGNTVLDLSADGMSANLRSDFLWAAEVFGTVVIPHILSGGTQAELLEMDREYGAPYRRQSAVVWSMYLGDSIPSVVLDENKKVRFNEGRHRTLAASIVGLEAIPMRTYSIHDLEESISDGWIDFKSPQEYLECVMGIA